MQVFLLVTFKILPTLFELTLERFDPVDGDDAPVFRVANDSQPAESESHRPVIRCLDARPVGGERGDHLLRVDAAFPAPLKSVPGEVKSGAHRWGSGGFDKDSTTLAESICLLGSSFVSSASARLRRAALLDDVSFCWPVISREIVASLRPEASASRFWGIPLATRKARISVVIVSMTKNYTNEIYLARFISSS